MQLEGADGADPAFSSAGSFRSFNPTGGGVDSAFSSAGSFRKLDPTHNRFETLAHESVHDVRVGDGELREKHRLVIAIERLSETLQQHFMLVHQLSEEFDQIQKSPLSIVIRELRRYGISISKGERKTARSRLEALCSGKLEHAKLNAWKDLLSMFRKEKSLCDMMNVDYLLPQANPVKMNLILLFKPAWVIS